jgi:hypothetical protein
MAESLLQQAGHIGMRQENSIHFTRSQAIHGVAPAETRHNFIEELARSSTSRNALPVTFLHQPRGCHHSAALTRHGQQLHQLLQPFFVRIVRKDGIPRVFQVRSQLQNHFIVLGALIQLQPTAQRPSKLHILAPHSSSTVSTNELDQHGAVGVLGKPLQLIYGCNRGARLAYP